MSAESLPNPRPRYRSRGLVVVVVVVVVVVTIGAVFFGVERSRSGPPPRIPAGDPVATTRGWFAAVNAHDMPLAQEYFVPSARNQMDWSSWGPPFQSLSCRLVSESQSDAVVGCKYKAITDASSGMSGDSGWSVDLTYISAGVWRINSYGQG
jgi:hypothetical protein